jgi:hypothetical protein
MKFYIPSIIKCTREVETVSSTGPYEVSCLLSRCQGTISGTTRIKTIFSFSPDTGKYFIGNALAH